MEKTYKISGSPSEATMSELSFLSFDEVSFINNNINTEGELEDYLNGLLHGKFKVLYEPFLDGRAGQTYVFRVWDEADNMSYADAMVEVQRALVGYVEDSAGADSPESKNIERAWQRIQKELSLLDEALDNSYFVVSMVEAMRERSTGYEFIKDREEEEGTGGLMDLCKEISKEFTEKYFYYQFDGDFDDKLEEFFEAKDRFFKS